MILIPFGDEYLGYCISSHLSSIPSLRSHLRILHSKQQHSRSSKNRATIAQTPPWLVNFASKGMDVREVKYMHPNDMSLAMRNVDHIILSLDTSSKRVERCKYICDAAVKAHVRNIIFVSHVGAAAAFSADDTINSGYQALSDYVHVEKHLAQLQEQEGDGALQWTILRVEWIQQYLHLWSLQAETTGSIALPLYEDTEICPVDISDVCRVILQLIMDDNGNLLADLTDCHVGQVYVLSGPRAITIRDIVRSLEDATQYTAFDCRDITKVGPIETCYYLKHLSHNVWFDKRLKKERAQAFDEHFITHFGYRATLIWCPTDLEIQTHLEYFDWVNQTAASIVTSNTRLLLHGCEPRPLQDFFAENVISFKPRV